MNITAAAAEAAIRRAIATQEGYLHDAIDGEDWIKAGEIDAYVRGLRFSLDMIQMARIEND